MIAQPCMSSSQRRPSRTVLLVEDEPFVREATCSILQRAGFAVLPARDADDALQIFENCKHSIDLVMTDMVLPGRTGQELGQDLRQHSPEIKVLVTSGYSNAEYATEDPSSQTYFLAKPYSRRALVERIEQIFRVIPMHRAAGRAV